MKYMTRGEERYYKALLQLSEEPDSYFLAIKFSNFLYNRNGIIVVVAKKKAAQLLHIIREEEVCVCC